MDGRDNSKNNHSKGFKIFMMIYYFIFGIIFAIGIVAYTFGSAFPPDETDEVLYAGI